METANGLLPCFWPLRRSLIKSSFPNYLQICSCQVQTSCEAQGRLVPPCPSSSISPRAADVFRGSVKERPVVMKTSAFIDKEVTVQLLILQTHLHMQSCAIAWDCSRHMFMLSTGYSCNRLGIVSKLAKWGCLRRLRLSVILCSFAGCSSQISYRHSCVSASGNLSAHHIVITVRIVESRRLINSFVVPSFY